MSNKRAKITIDILMTIFLILSFIRWEGIGGAIYHIIVGSACALFFSIHIFIHRKWIKATTRSCFAGKLGFSHKHGRAKTLSKALRGKYIINTLLLIVWGISIITGFIAVLPFFAEAENMLGWGRIHGITARIGLVFIIIHVIQHIPQIKSYFGIKKRAKDAD